MPEDENENDLLRTVADELVDLVKKSGEISVEDAAKKLKMSVQSMQALVDFFVEEKIFGIEYKFTTPYIYLYKDNVKRSKDKDDGLIAGLITKEQFYDKAKKRNVPHENIEGLWRKYLKANITSIRDEFVKKARLKKISEEKIDELWSRYLGYL